MQSDEQQILKLFEDADRAIIAADLVALSRIFADDYIQCDESGKSFTKQDVLNNLRSGAIRPGPPYCPSTDAQPLTADA